MPVCGMGRAHKIAAPNHFGRFATPGHLRLATAAISRICRENGLPGALLQQLKQAETPPSDVQRARHLRYYAFFCG